MRGVGDEIWVYLVTDETGETGVGYAMTAGAAKVPLIADSERGAELLRPIVSRLAKLTGRPFTLARFSKRIDVETIQP